MLIYSITFWSSVANLIPLFLPLFSKEGQKTQNILYKYCDFIIEIEYLLYLIITSTNQSVADALIPLHLVQHVKELPQLKRDEDSVHNSDFSVESRSKLMDPSIFWCTLLKIKTGMKPTWPLHLLRKNAKFIVCVNQVSLNNISYSNEKKLVPSDIICTVYLDDTINVVCRIGFMYEIQPSIQLTSLLKMGVIFF